MYCCQVTNRLVGRSGKTSWTREKEPFVHTGKPQQRHRDKCARLSRRKILCRVIKLWLEKKLEPDYRGPRMPYTDLLPTGSEVSQDFLFVFKQ